MARRFKREADVIDLLTGKIENINKLMSHLQNNSQPTVPKYNVGAEPSNLLNGQIWIDDNDALKYRSGGFTRSAAPSWSAFTPTWTQSGGNPTLGNGFFGCQYAQVGKIVFITFGLTWGSTTSASSGIWLFSLPITKAAGTPLFGSGLSANSGVANFSAFPALWNDTQFTFFYHAISAAGAVGFYSDTGGPFVFGASDWITASFWYASAS